MARVSVSSSEADDDPITWTNQELFDPAWPESVVPVRPVRTCTCPSAPSVVGAPAGSVVSGVCSDYAGPCWTTMLSMPRV